MALNLQLRAVPGKKHSCDPSVGNTCTAGDGVSGSHRGVWEGLHSIHYQPPGLRALGSQVFKGMHAVSLAYAPICYHRSQPIAKFSSSI